MIHGHLERTLVAPLRGDVQRGIDPDSFPAFADLLHSMGACAPARAWVCTHGYSLAQAYRAAETPEHAEWFRWFLAQVGIASPARASLVALRRAAGGAKRLASGVVLVAGALQWYVGCGGGSGFGSGYGYGSGSSSGDGDGDGYGCGCGYGDGYGYGYGSGYGHGFGYGCGSGSGAY